MTTDRRNDSGLVRPMFEASERRFGRPIKRVLADCGFAQADDIAALSSRSEAPVGVYIHPVKDRTDVKPATLLKRQKQREREPQAIKEWRQRMATDEAEAVMKKEDGSNGSTQTSRTGDSARFWCEDLPRSK